MNIDLAAQTQFKDAQGLRNFLLVHQFVHDQTATALNARFSVPVSSFGISSIFAEDAWLSVMTEGKGAIMPDSLKDWLKIHADIHTQSYTLLGQSPTTAPDLSVADFSQAQGFDDWMFVHQQMHDFEYSQLGLS